MNNKKIYKVIFQNQNNIYELYAYSVTQSDMFGFIEVSEIVFGERSQILLDPSDEKVKAEFSNVKTTYIPVQSIERIDCVDKVGPNKLTMSNATRKSNIAHFPSKPIK